MSLEIGGQLTLQSFLGNYTILMACVWGFGVDLVRLSIRYGKAYPSAINFHSICMLLMGSLTILYVITQIAVYLQNYGNSYNGLEGTAMVQFVFSIILAIAVCFQFVFGFVTRSQMINSRLSSSLFKVKFIHKAIGNCLSLFGKVTFLLLVHFREDEDTFKAWVFTIVAFLIIMLVVEGVYRTQSSSFIISPLLKHKSKKIKYLKQILDNINKGNKQYPTYKDKGIRYIIHNNTMHYIDEQFIHPGGEYIINYFNGRQINYYFAGARSIGVKYPVHRHNKYVMAYLEERVVGEVQAEKILLNQRFTDEIVEWRGSLVEDSGYKGMRFVTLETDAGNIREYFKPQNFGKYIMMGCSSEQIIEKVQRPFFICHSLSHTQQQITERLRKVYRYYFMNESQVEDKKQKINKESVLSSSKLTFCVKQARKSLFSKFLVTKNRERTYTVDGPYGEGLRLDAKEGGYVVVVAVGMGVVALADLFTYLLQKTLYELIGSKCSQANLKKANPEKINFSNLSSLRVLLIGSFSNSKQFYMADPIRELYALNEKHRLGQFNMMIRYQNSQNEDNVRMIRQSFDRDFFMGLCEDQQPDRLIFSGPVKLEEYLRGVQEDLNLKEPIHYV